MLLESRSKDCGIAASETEGKPVPDLMSFFLRSPSDLLMGPNGKPLPKEPNGLLRILQYYLPYIYACEAKRQQK